MQSVYVKMHVFRLYYSQYRAQVRNVRECWCLEFPSFKHGLRSMFTKEAWLKHGYKGRSLVLTVRISLHAFAIDLFLFRDHKF